MKKLILFLLFPLLSFSQTYSSVSALIDSNLSSGSKITAVKHREVEHAILDYLQLNISQSGDIKRIKCDLTYLNDNFEVDGLGKNLRAGWAICNGNNGTDNLAGRVGIGYGIGYSALGSTGGDKDAVVVSHSHYEFANEVVDAGAVISASNQPVKEGFNAGGDGNQNYRIRGTNTASTVGKTSLTGVSGTDKNMQPYIIQLYIMKL